VPSSPELGAAIARSKSLLVDVLLSADPPVHDRTRSLLAKVFTPRRVAALEPGIREVADRLVDSFAGAGTAELVGGFAADLPLTVIADELGVPRRDLADFGRWSDDFMAALNPSASDAEQLRSVESIVEMETYFEAAIDEARDRPRDDILSGLVHATAEDGAALTVPELLSVLRTLLVGGNETTTRLIATAVWLVLSHEDTRMRVTRDPELLAGVVEEALRMESPIQVFPRVCTADTELAGTSIPAGAVVIVLFGSANRDETVFDEPGRFDPTRPNARSHLAFGQGTHFCLGASLARAEARVALGVLLDRLPGLALAPGAPVEFEPNFNGRGLRALHVEWNPTSGSRSG
jgi:cytochrome P450